MARRRTMQAAVWLCLGACAVGLSDVGEDFRLVDESGSDVLADAAANVAHRFRPAARTLDLSFRAHNTTFGYRLHRQVSPAGGEVFSYGEDGTLTRSALDEHLFFRSPDHDAVLTIVGRSFQGTVRLGSKVFDIEHEHGSPTLLVQHVTHLSGDMTGLHPNGSVAHSAPSGRRLATKTPTKWEDCWEVGGHHGPMKAFKIGVVVTSNVYKHYKWSNKEQAQEWVQDKITRANAAYNAQLHVHLTLGSLVVQESTSGAPSWDNGGCPKTINQQLAELGKWHPVDTSVGIWHLFDNCFNWNTGGTIGLAYVGVLCWPYGHMNYNNGITWISDREDNSPTYHTFAHEVGHNFGAQHSFEEGQGKTGGIMDYGVNGMLDGMHQFNEKYRKTQMCNHIKSKLSCPAFSQLVPACGNGVKEAGEECECADGSTGCQGCCSCKLQLNTAGSGATQAECAAGDIDNTGCCTDDGNFAEVGASCTQGNPPRGGYCNKGKCITENVCTGNSMFNGYCGLDGCKINCISAANGTCHSLSHISDADGGSIGNLPPNTACKDSSGLHGKCSATGDCITGKTVMIEGEVSTLAPADPNPYSTEKNFTGCVGFTDRGFLGKAEQVWVDGKTLDDCNLACLDSPKCHSFIHKADAGFCELWSRYHKDEDMAVVPGYDTYICDLRAAGFDFLDAVIYENTIVAPGGVPSRSRSKLSGMTRSTCYKTCATDPGCHIFVFGKTDGSCKLYTSEVSEVNFDPAAAGSENYDTYKMSCHGRNKICECDPSPTAKIRQPCQCNSVSSPYKNECDIDRYCHSGVCSDAPQRRMGATDYCAAPTTLAPTSAPTPSPTPSPTSSPTPSPTPPPTPPPTPSPPLATVTSTTLTSLTTTVTSTTRTTTTGTSITSTRTSITTKFTTTRTSVSFTHTSVTTTTTTQKFSVRVEMALKSTGSKEDVESATVDMAAAKHSVAKDKVTATAKAIAAARRLLGKDRKLTGASYQWKVDYELVLDDKGTAEQHLQIAKDLETNKDATKQSIQESFESAGLTVDTSDLDIEAPTQVEIHSVCYDTNLGRKDPFDDACEVYRRDKDLCGNWDDEDFSSNTMCCACGGGSETLPEGTPLAPETPLEPEPGCTSTDNGAKDETGDGCSVYEEDPLNWCGQFDDDDFDSMVMCCACRPYAPPTPAPATPAPAPGGMMDDVKDTLFGLIDGAASQRLSALAVIAAAFALGA